MTGSRVARLGSTGARFSGHHATPDNVNVFAQYRHSWDRAVSGFDRALTAGLVVDPPLGWTGDYLGFGVFYGHPIDPRDREEYGVEVYYRLQLTHRLDFSPYIQVFRAGRAGRAKSTVVVAGRRLRLLF